ncbi:MAG: hypothetical protein KC877_03725 [Candidatus Kaiserbacteria bacterium]|nr:hypothetical protein [Candidatus Kaiserbacteria bacterium]MCB9816584.1 hypothetical protein [Candidatus Nomurabacteria bacterium]
MRQSHMPYIGITDFTSPEQVRDMLGFMDDLTFSDPLFDRVLHVGVMMSRKTLMGIETKWAKAFPPKENIARIFSYPEAYNCLHYANFDYSTGIEDELVRALSYGGENLRAIQLDMTWPDPDNVHKAMHRTGKNIEVIMQIGKKAQAMCGDDPKRVAEYLDRYTGVVDRVLLDKSMGMGLGMDAMAMLPFLREISERIPQLQLVVAGGLGPTSLHLLDPVLAEFPRISFDAQGKLRPSGDALNEPLDWHYVRSYLYQAIAKIYYYQGLAA